MDEIYGENRLNVHKWRFYNIIILGFAFMLMFTAFQTSSMIEQTILEGAKAESNFTGNGYTSLAIIYGVFASANWLAPSFVAICGAKLSMLIGGICYTLFIASFLRPMVWSLYTGSVLVGIGAAIIWTGQGNFLTINSDSETIGRNSGIFWALLQCSLLFGNLYIYFEFSQKETIDSATRFKVYVVLTSLCAAGVVFLLFLRASKSVVSSAHLHVNDENVNHKTGPLEALKKSFRLFFTKEMLLLCASFAYTGLELTFFSGVYGTCVGHTQAFKEQAKSLQGLSGILIGCGEIVGGAVFGLLGKKISRFGRDPVVFFGFIVHTACFYLIFINLPVESPIKETSSATFLGANKYIVLLCAFLLGLGDSSYNTQIYSILGASYPRNSAPAFALYKFIQSVSAAVGFFYSNILYLQWQLLILAVFNGIGAFTFFLVERLTKVEVHPEGYHRIAVKPREESESEANSD